MERLIGYLYDLDYDPPILPNRSAILEFHVHMSVIADKYDMTALRTLAAKKFQIECEKSRLSEAEMASAAAAAYEYQGPAADICAHIVRMAIDSRILLPTRDSATFQQVMKTYPELGIDMAKAQASRPEPLKKGETRMNCAECSRDFIVALEELQTTGQEYYCFWCGSGHTVGEWRAFKYM